MNLILCEGKRDAWFFHQIMKDHSDIDSILCMPDSAMSKLQGLLGSNCFNHTRNKYSLLIFGDTGKPTIIDKVLRRVVVDTLGKIKDDIYIFLILDDDGISYQELYDNVLTKVQLIITNTSSFNILPNLENSNDLLIISHPKSRGIIRVKLVTVPMSLEDQVANKIIDVKYPQNRKILGDGPEKTLHFLSKKYYNSYEEMIRESSMLLKHEKWVAEISTICSTH